MSTLSVTFALLLSGAVFYGIVLYNRLVRLRQRFRNAFAQIDVQLKRRHDLIPNLVESVRGYLTHEREVLENVIRARQSAVRAQDQVGGVPQSAGALGVLAGAEQALTGAIGRLFALSEAYPELKGDRSVADLQEALRTTENRVAFARQAYNDAVMRYNTARTVFPAVLVSEPMGFDAAPLFGIEDESERRVPRVRLS